MKCHIYLFRHAQTFYNKSHIFTGHKDSKLTPKGIKEAHRLARKLQDKRIDVAFHTRLTRSKHTLKIVLKYHPECHTIIEDNRMIERDYGELSGRHHASYITSLGEELYKILHHWHKVDHLWGQDHQKFIKKIGTAEYDIFHRSYSHAPPGGESVKMVEKRVKSFIRYLEKYIKKHKVNVAISAHGNSMRPFRRYFENLSIAQMMALENPWDDYFHYTITV